MLAKIDELRAIYMLEENEDEMRDTFERWGAELCKMLAAGPRLDENKRVLENYSAALDQSVAGVQS